MNQKEYELLAGSIARTRQASSLEKNAVKREARQAAIRLLVSDLIGTLTYTYPNFDETKFKEACGL